MRRTIQGTILRSSFVIYPITKVGSFLNQKLHTSFSPSRRFFHFFPSWNIDLRARPWALWNFLRSTSPLTHRCRNIIPPARYFNLALSTRQGPEKKKLHRFSFFFPLLSFSPFSAEGWMRQILQERRLKKHGWKMETILFLIGCRARVCVCVCMKITWQIRERNRIVEKSSSILWNHFQLKNS